MQNDAHNFLSLRAFVRVQRSVAILDERRITCIKYNYESIIILSHHQRLHQEVSVFLMWRRKWWKCRLQPFLVHDIFATKQFDTLSYYSTCTTPLCSVFVLRSPAAPAHPGIHTGCYSVIAIKVSISVSTILLKPSSISNMGDTFGKYR